MRQEQIKLCYRATFRQPIGALNPAGFELTSPIEVEIRKAGAHWAAFRPGSKAQFQQITAQPSASTLQGQLALFFAERISEWRVWQILPNVGYQPLEPGSFSIDPQGRAFKNIE